MAGHSDGIEPRAVPPICLAPPEHWKPGPSAEAVLACAVWLHFEAAVHGVSVEGIADCKGSRWTPGDSLHADLWRVSPVAGGWLFRSDLRGIGTEASSGRAPRHHGHPWRPIAATCDRARRCSCS